MEFLNVYLKNNFIGKLGWNKKELNFIYDEHYLKRNDATAVSISLPLSRDFNNETTTAFFSGLLPDEGLRSRLAKYLHISDDNTFALLKEIGAECAGAISILPENKTPQAPHLPSYIKLDEEQAYDLLGSLKKIPLGIDAEENFRISGSGAQDKLIACVKESSVFIPQDGTASTHIIKPQIEGIQFSEFNEFFCMQLAKKMGLDVADSFLLTIKDKAFYVTQRYDRTIDENGYIVRLHQEDFCQALKIEPKIKYENEGGPDVLKCFECIRENSALAGRDVLRFIEALVFNFLIGNGDAHGKNFSFLYDNGRAILAPLYDLMSTMALHDFNRKDKMAMRIDGEYLFTYINKKKFEQQAEIMRMKKDVFNDVFYKKFSNIIQIAQELADKLNKNPETTSPVYDKIVKIIITNYQKLK